MKKDLKTTSEGYDEEEITRQYTILAIIKSLHGFLNDWILIKPEKGEILLNQCLIL